MRRAVSSVGQSTCFTRRGSQVQVLYRPLATRGRVCHACTEGLVVRGGVVLVVGTLRGEALRLADVSLTGKDLADSHKEGIVCFLLGDEA
jgi:hypothetical protein